jgi:cis-L-3-hydroxyproline dehydratase
VPLFCDANGGWTRAEARRFLAGTRGLDYALEQPCVSYEDLKALRPQCDRPLILDETIDGLGALLRALADGVADGVTVKIARVGGITPARLLRDVAVEAGLLVTVEDTGGAEIDTAAMAHLSLSTPDGYRQHTVDFDRWVTVGNADGMPAASDGLLPAPEGPGRGVRVREAELGEPFAVYRL